MPNVTKADLGRFNYGHTFTANGTSAVTVAYPQLTLNNQVQITLQTVGGTPAGAPYLATKTPGTGFTVKAASGDTSIYVFRVI